MNKPEMIELKDIPPNVSAELERLHEIIQGAREHYDPEQKKWAQEKIDRIHELFFMGAIFVPERETLK